MLRAQRRGEAVSHLVSVFRCRRRQESFHDAVVKSLAPIKKCHERRARLRLRGPHRLS